MPPTTKDRILTEALRLFSERGYKDTSVGDIEAAAGLSPRSGALYKHFPSKAALLEAAIAQRTEEIAEMDQQLELVDLGDVRAELTFIARWALAELRRERELARLIMKEGDRAPTLAVAFRDAIVRRGHAVATQWVVRQSEKSGVPVADPAAVAEVTLASLVGWSLQELMFGEGFVDVDEERFIASWVQWAQSLVPDPERSSLHA